MAVAIFAGDPKGTRKTIVSTLTGKEFGCRGEIGIQGGSTDVEVPLDVPDIRLQVTVFIPTDTGEDVLYCRTRIGDMEVSHPVPFDVAVSAAFLSNDRPPASLAEQLFAGVNIQVSDTHAQSQGPKVAGEIIFLRNR